MGIVGRIEAVAEVVAGEAVTAAIVVPAAIDHLAAAVAAEPHPNN
jgi:hypothetical protein